ncbi:hypothetical protein B0H14DRAFT_2564184 [Mycena olivaceomarginata]|nr:hypothetical protein B0H14DRAFT_2564184 [Mycena olivaceomarginata]
MSRLRLEMFCPPEATQNRKLFQLISPAQENALGEDAPDRIYHTATLVALPTNIEVESLLRQLKNKHQISYEPPKAIVFTSLSSTEDGTVVQTHIIEEPDTALAGSLISLLQTSPASSVSVSRTPLPLNHSKALDSTNGYLCLGMYEDVLSGALTRAEVPRATDSDALAELLQEEYLPKETPCYVLYFSLESQQRPARSEPAVGGSSPSSTLFVPQPQPATGSLLAPPLPICTFLHEGIQNHTSMTTPQISVNHIVDWVEGPTGSATWRNWRNKWGLAQDVFALLSNANTSVAGLSVEDHADWVQLYAFIGSPPCLVTPIPTEYELLAKLTTDKYIAHLHTIRERYRPADAVENLTLLARSMLWDPMPALRHDTVYMSREGRKGRKKGWGMKNIAAPPKETKRFAPGGDLRTREGKQARMRTHLHLECVLGTPTVLRRVWRTSSVGGLARVTMGGYTAEGGGQDRMDRRKDKKAPTIRRQIIWRRDTFKVIQKTVAASAPVPKFGTRTHSPGPSSNCTFLLCNTTHTPGSAHSVIIQSPAPHRNRTHAKCPLVARQIDREVALGGKHL